MILAQAEQAGQEILAEGLLPGVPRQRVTHGRIRDNLRRIAQGVEDGEVFVPRTT